MSEREKKLIEQFGLKSLPREIGVEHHYVKRGILFAYRGEEIFEALRNRHFYVLTGIMPSYDKIHLGTVGVIEAVKAFSKLSKYTVILVADLESLSTRNIPLEKAYEIALDTFIPTYLALGVDPERTYFYFQSKNEDLAPIMFDAAREITLSEFEAVYGNAEPPRVLSVLCQIADLVFPQLREPMIGIIPVGLDQDPHIRLGRDYVRRTRFYNFRQIVGVYIKDVPNLSGTGKMSKSEPHNAIFLPEEDEENLRRKIYKAFSGGGATIEEHRQKGADLSSDVPYRILQFILDDEGELSKITEEYSSGKMLSGEVKKYLYDYLLEFYKKFRERYVYYKDVVRRGGVKIIRSHKQLNELT